MQYNKLKNIALADYDNYINVINEEMCIYTVILFICGIVYLFFFVQKENKNKLRMHYFHYL